MDAMGNFYGLGFLRNSNHGRRWAFILWTILINKE